MGKDPTAELKKLDASVKELQSGLKELQTAVKEIQKTLTSQEPRFRYLENSSQKVDGQITRIADAIDEQHKNMKISVRAVVEQMNLMSRRDMLMEMRKAAK